MDYGTFQLLSRIDQDNQLVKAKLDALIALIGSKEDIDQLAKKINESSDALQASIDKDKKGQ